MPYWECFYHIVWATKGRAPMIAAHNETLILDTIENQSIRLKCPVHALNAVEDHVHVAVSILPSLSVADWVGRVKGAASKLINDTFPDSLFQWQEGYGVLTFGPRNLPFIRQYIQNQKEHHRQQTLYMQLEQTES